ncbi:MAG: ribonucleoside triphosphate reductase, partial [Nanoarchaeota archaeon]
TMQDWRIKENANMTYSLQGLNFHVSSIVASQYWLDNVYPEEIKNAHVRGEFHLHDLGILGPYCVGWDLQDLLENGFRGVKGKVSCKAPKHLRTALGQIINFFYTMQGEAAGAQAFSNFDTFLAPFIRYDNLTYKEVRQALQEFLFNINVPTRVGFQTPFTNISLDLHCPDFMKDMPVIIGGTYMKETYGDFNEEIVTFNRALVETLTEGDASGRVFSFPIPTYNITKDFDWDNPNYTEIWEMTAKYGIPYFSNFVNSDMDPSDVRSMCCHLRLDNRELQKRGGGLFGSNPLTGSIGVVTINMPRLGYLAGNDEEFFMHLDRVLELARNSLEVKRKVLENLTERGLFPYSHHYLRGVKAKHDKYWQNHFSTIGLVGLNECCLNYLGQDIGSAEGISFAERVLDHMRDRLAEFQETTGHMYNLEATPAEGTAYRLARIDKETIPHILVANNAAWQNGAEPYYTNSSHLPVYYTDDLFKNLRIQDGLQTKYTGGTVIHVYLGEKRPSAEAVKSLVKKVCSNFKLPYFTITPTFSICEEHGYLFGEHKTCPTCTENGKETCCEVYSRIVGYLRPVDQWNAGKQEEWKQREKYDKALHEDRRIAEAELE